MDPLAIDQFSPRRGSFFWATNPTLQPIHVPKWASMAWMLCIGSGAGGAGGQTSATGVLGGGGGGGGSGASGRCVMPVAFLPKSLFFYPGIAGLGGNAAGAGGAGQRSFINAAPSGSAPNNADVVLISGSTAAAIVNAPAGASAGGGSAETLGTPSVNPFAGCLGTVAWFAGQNGGSGGASGGAGVTIGWGGSGLLWSSGAGGGTTNTTTGNGAGGGQTGSGTYVTAIAGGVAGGATPGANGLQLGPFIGGKAGVSIAAQLPFASTGGAGGGAHAGGVAGAGGNAGGIGSGGGGGGGGGGTGGGTGGKGGNGGSGLVLIVFW